MSNFPLFSVAGFFIFSVKPNRYDLFRKYNRYTEIVYPKKIN